MSVLVLLESPKKQNTVKKILGDNYEVMATLGHFRDLPNKDEIPESHRNAAWASLGVNTDGEYELLYVVKPDRADNVRKLREAIKKAEKVVIATDLDREGEAIAQHVVDYFKPRNYERVTFADLTKTTILAAMAAPRGINHDLVEAQEARRGLDRLYGYRVSPALSRRAGRPMSAGRVQTVAARIIVDLERARMRFVKGQFAAVEIQLEGGIKAQLKKIAGQKVAASSDFDPLTGQTPASVRLLNQADAQKLLETARTEPLEIVSREQKKWRKSPPEPFVTITMNVEAGRRFSWDIERVSRTAQALYEKGLVTYIRTDSPGLSEEATQAAREAVSRLFPGMVPAAPRVYKAKKSDAQEAHEAIRPAGDQFTPPDQMAGLSDDEAKLYRLIYERTLASQMLDAEGLALSIALDGAGETRWSASARITTEPGFTRLFQETKEDDEAEEPEATLPDVSEGQRLKSTGGRVSLSETKPPARLNETTLAKKLDEDGLGRPSTFTSMVTTIQKRGYAERDGRALVPTWFGHALIGSMEELAQNLIDYSFTSEMEKNLDKIASGKMSRVDYLREFHAGRQGLEATLSRAGGGSGHPPVLLPQLKLPEGESVHLSENGPYLRWSGGNHLLPENVAPHEVTAQTLERAKRDGRELPAAKAPSTTVKLGDDPESGWPVYKRNGQYGPYVQRGDQKTTDKPDRRNVNPEEFESLSLEQALEYLNGTRTFQKRPDSLGTHSSGLPIYIIKGKHGPYLQLGWTEQGSEEKPRRVNVAAKDFEAGMTLETVLDYLEGRKSAIPSLGIDPESGKRVYMRRNERGVYLQLGEGENPRYASIPEDEIKGMKLPRALLHLKAQRVLGERNGEKIQIGLGKNGYYLRCGSEFRDVNLEEAGQLTLAQAIERLNAPRPPRKQGDAGKSQQSAVKKGSKR